MANSKYEYVRQFEEPDRLLPNMWIVVRIDGRGFHKLSTKYGFVKPNDKRALELMNTAAMTVMSEFPDLFIAYGGSDEYSFVFHKSCELFERRRSKLVSMIVSTFTASYVHLWPSFFENSPLSPPLPSFDGRATLFPNEENLRDYMSWRQVDCHINNLYNTTFWALIQLGKLGAKDAEKALMGTYASDKNEILFSRFGINYNNEIEIFKKGSVIVREYELVEPPIDSRLGPHDKVDLDDATPPGAVRTESEVASLSKTQQERDRKRRSKARINVLHIDIIKDDFWKQRPWLLSGRPGKIPKEP